MASDLGRRAERELTRGAERVTEADLKRVAEKREVILGKVFSSRHLVRFLEDVRLMLAMNRDYITGRYRAIPWNSIAASGAALLYVLNPLDLIPDFIPGIGYLDDGVVIMLALRLMEKDLHRYRRWRDSIRESAGDPGKS